MKRLYWILFFALLLLPIVVNFVCTTEILSFAKRKFPYWSNITQNVLFKDILFIEGAVLLILGALVGGVTLYNACFPTDVRKAQFTEYIWNWKKLREARNFLTGLIVGLVLIAFGIIYIALAILFLGFPLQ